MTVVSLLQHPLRRLFAGATLCALVVALLTYVAPHVLLAPLPAFALAFACVSAQILALAALAPALSLRDGAPPVAFALAVLATLHGVAPPVKAASAAALTFALGVGATLIGAALGQRIERAGQLVAVALVSAIADLWSVFDPGAPSAQLAAQALAEPERLALFALPFPLLGTPLVPAIIGAGDVLFTALYVAAFRAHGLSLSRLVCALALAYALGLLGLVLLLRPLPLLPLLGLAAIACEPAARSLTRREWRTVLTVCAALVVLVALLRSR